MGFSSHDANAFLELFTSNTDAYGTTLVGEIENGKAKSESSLVHKELTAAVILRHLNGEISIGAAPLRDGDTVRWCAIDIDSYVYNLYDIVEAIEDFDLPLVPCLSKSKKLHIYCFFSEEAPADEAVELMRWYISAFRCDPKTEIFPKQTHTSANNKFYSWINLPYFDAANEDNWRKSVIRKDEYRDLGDFIDIAEARSMTIKEHKAFLEKLPYHDAPPCVISGVLLRDVGPGIRNNWFFNVACYLRMQDEGIDLEEPLLELNDTLHSPLPKREILTTVSKVSSKSYFYQCAGMIGCNKKACAKTDNGIGSTNTTGYDLGQLTKIMTDPIQWTWEINGQKLAFHDTKQILQQENFRRLCMEKLDKLPQRVSDEKWTKIISRALENVVHEEVNLRGEFGKGAQFIEVLAQYFAGGRRRALNITQIYRDKVFLDEVHQRYVFTAHSLRAYVIDKHQVPITDNELRARMVEIGARKENDVWFIGTKDVPQYNEPEVKIDYTDKEGYEDNDGIQF